MHFGPPEKVYWNQYTAANPLSPGTDYETLAKSFRPIFREISAGNVGREIARTLPYEPIAWLSEIFLSKQIKDALIPFMPALGPAIARLRWKA